MMDASSTDLYYCNACGEMTEVNSGRLAHEPVTCEHCGSDDTHCVSDGEQA